jgi:hypothetical protein
MQKYVIHQNIERKMQCIIDTLGMKERKEKTNLNPIIVGILNNGFLNNCLKQKLNKNVIENILKRKI